MLENKYTPKELQIFSKMRVLILSPVMFDYPRFWTSMVNMMGFSWNHGLKVDEIGILERTVVDWAREELAREGKKRKCLYTDELYTHLLWLDSDHRFKADLLCQLARHDKDMVSALYYKRLKDPTPVVFVANREDPEGLSHFPLLEIPPRLCEVDAAGFGAMLMRRDVLERVPEPWFLVDWKVGEDFMFCVKARKYGVKIYVDGAYTVAHIGDNKLVTRVDYEKWYRENEEKIMADRVPVTLGGDNHGEYVDPESSEGLDPVGSGSGSRR